MTSFIAAGGSARSTSFMPAVPAALSVTTIAFIVHLPVRGGPSSSEFPCRQDGRGGDRDAPLEPSSLDRVPGSRSPGVAMTILFRSPHPAQFDQAIEA